MSDDTELWVMPATDEMGCAVGDSILENVHPATVCVGRPCVLHNPSDHHMRDWKLLWRDDRHMMERICSHGVGHPDPDDLAWHIRNGREYQGVHGCDGCCRVP